MSERTQRLKKNVVIKTHKITARGLEREEEGKPFREGMEVKLCLDRARLITEAYKRYEHEPLVMKRGLSLAHILENMEIYIQPDELIVGNFASAPNKVAHYPELQFRWLEKTICTADGPYKDLLTDEEKEEMLRLHEYWKTRAVHSLDRKYLPKDLEKFFYFKGINFWTYNWEISTPNYEKIFKTGFEGIIKEIEAKIKEVEDDYRKMVMDSKEYLEKKIDLEAMLSPLKGAITWAKRYAALAKKMAKEEKDGRRKKELEKIADVCSWVPEKPPRTLRDAIQCFWLLHLIVGFIEEPQVGCGVRFDKVFYPFYKKDIEAGKITREEAQELFECVWIKFLETGFLHPPIWSGSGGGGLGWQTVTIGGTTNEGGDVTNDVTYLVLDSVDALKTLQPPLALRWHSGTPRELLLRATEVLGTGIGQPAIFNDHFNIPRLMKLGVPLEDVRDYAISTCMWPVIPGKNIVHRASNTGPFMTLKCLELALNQGRDMGAGEQLGPETKDPLTFSSIDEIIEATMEQFMYFMRGEFYLGNLANRLYEIYLQRPFLSALLDGCIERGQELRKWVYMPYNDVLVLGTNNIADSLAAIKKLIFDEKKVAMAELLDALKKNWEGHEELRQMCLNAPKFGNDDDYVDLIAREMHYKFADGVQSIKSYPGNVPAIPDGSAASCPYGYSGPTWATPDGRRAGDPYHDGAISPMMGTDRNGPTAALKSISKIDPLRANNNFLLNQTFMPQFLKDEYKEVFADYLNTWGDLGIHHIQFSVVDRETLIDAQEHPEKHDHLIVRVCGYSAYFTDLSKGLQDAVVERTQQSFA